jgi:hypothetical protein
MYKEKYLKYKNKYLELKKNQKAGMGSVGYTSWSTFPDYEDKNNKNKKKILLAEDYSELENQNENYLRVLTNLLKKSEDNLTINLDFINNFYREIYYDNDGTFEIKYEKDNMKINASFVKPNKYEIMKMFIQAHGNSSILFIKNKDSQKEYVFKVYNNINVDITELKNYLSLQIIHIMDKTDWNFQNNYVQLTKEQFNVLNFNDETELIKTQNGNLYIACRNNDAINDYIINLILQQINKEKNLNLNFVKYHNLFVTKINGNYKYCIIMDKLDGDLKNYFDMNKENNDKMKLENIFNIFSDFENQLNKVKTSEYLFTHTV